MLHIVRPEQTLRAGVYLWQAKEIVKQFRQNFMRDRRQPGLRRD
jgi:hypothetical protein